MRRFIAFFCVIAALLMPMTTSCSTSRHNAGRDLHPDDVFTMTEDDIANETRRINLTLQGDWKYNAPSVGVSGKNLLAGIAKPIAKGKLKKKLKNAYKKIGLDKARPQFVFNVDGTCSMKLMGASVKGTYNYNPTTEKITFKWHGVPMNASLKRDGKKKLQLTFDADKLLKLMSLLGRFSDSSTIKALSTLLDNYEDVMVGFELKKQ
ncbi:MAG: DUF4923 family protein [Muribaculaceae bacterium]|jgi:hypothetical protein|nr:DUF4923 family protein [Muribaculaceae bacterium]MBR0493475.1 DUF4923 family protein [Muribaculaceae bacterium]